MPKVTRKSQPKRVIGLDRHRLGMLGGTAGALLVMCLSFFYSDAELAAAVIRAGWGFVVCYGATALLVHVILRATLLEYVAAKEVKRSRKGRANREGSAQAPAPAPEP